jgi:hypothetical protein
LYLSSVTVPAVRTCASSKQEASDLVEAAKAKKQYGLPYSNQLDLKQSSEMLVYKFQQASSQANSCTYLNTRSVFQEY